MLNTALLRNRVQNKELKEYVFFFSARFVIFRGCIFLSVFIHNLRVFFVCFLRYKFIKFSTSLSNIEIDYDWIYSCIYEPLCLCVHAAYIIVLRSNPTYRGDKKLK